ncbi:15877_t:CDS:2 [Acaulospora morrowiae]|uniref:15877_t:CDS:1 n=1 Tax=Acaulospora morrowiae TaxID=94023 RepID=A0A9N8YTP1_9GLOM|nr:15877_t:CDS:2 [Acaulospora morrowiae]
MYSQQHEEVPSSRHQTTGRNEYHSPGRGEYSPPLSDAYYTATPPFQTGHIPPHPMYPPPSRHYLPYHNIPPPQVPHPDEYSDQSSKKPDIVNVTNSTGIPENTKNKTPNALKNSTSQTLNSKAKFKKERFGFFDSQAIEEDDKRYACSIFSLNMIIGDLPFSTESALLYSLIVCQQPLRARMCGFGEKDRRPIDPPPIVQLVVNDDKGNLDTSAGLSMLQNPFFVLHVTLWSEDCKEERNVISNPPKTTRVLMGSLVSSPAILKNTTGDAGCYFCFPDLSIRTEGKYTLKFSLMKLGSEDRLISTRTEIIATTFSDPFTVYSAKKFPGMTESTELSKAFAKQGLKIPIRNDVRPRKVAED